jgi:hypothetical protein
VSDHAETPTLSAENAPRFNSERLDRVRFGLLIGGIGALGLSLLGLLSDVQQLLLSYLVAYMFFLSIALGALFFVMIHHLTKAGWSVSVRRLAEGLSTAFPLLAILFLPVVIGMHDLFHWTHADAVATDHLLQHKQGYLNTPFFLIRAALYFVVWIGLSRYFYKRSLAQDADGDVGKSAAMERMAAPGMLLFAVTVTFASFDWLMSLDPHWFSTIFGVYFFAGCAIGIFATLAIASVALVRSGVVSSSIIRGEQQHDLGKFLFAMVVFWAYIGFSQMMLYWYGNLPEETLWFHHRWHGGWKVLSIALIAFHFVLPFLMLIGRWAKRRGTWLVFMCVWMLLMHYADLYWLIMPVYQGEIGPKFGTALATLIGVGCLVLAWVASRMRDVPLVPLRDPRMHEALSYDVGI